MPYPGLLHPGPLPLWQSTADLYLHRRHSNTALSVSVGSMGPDAHKVFLSPLRISRSYERLLLNHAKTPGFLASGGKEFNLGLEVRLDLSELLCNKVLLK